MTLEQFRATRRDVPDLQAVLGQDVDFMDEGQAGCIYLGQLWIMDCHQEMDVPSHWYTSTGAEGDYYDDDLAPLEEVLWRYAAEEGLIQLVE
jgi:hypothetical protein